MITETIAQRYAQAIFRIAQENNLVDKIYKELTFSQHLLETAPQLINILEHPQLALMEKFRILNKILREQISPLVQRILELLIRKGRLRYLSKMISAYQNLVDQDRGVLRIKLRSYLPLTKSEESQLIKSLQSFHAQMGTRKIKLECSTDPSLLGGLILQIGNEVIDGSLRQQLYSLREYLLARISTE